MRYACMKPNPMQADLEQLFRDCGNDLNAYFARRHGGGQVAADLVQESFLQLARRLQNGQVVASPRAYLFGIARHVSMAFFRLNRRTILEGAITEAERASKDEPDGRIVAAHEVIAGLPALQREILDLRFVHDLSYAEIAIALGIPTGTVRSRLHHAIALLRETLELEENGERALRNRKA